MYEEPGHTSGVEFYAKEIDDLMPFAAFAEISVLDV